MNGFEIQNETDVGLERRQELVTNIRVPTSGEADTSNKVLDNHKVDVDDDMQYPICQLRGNFQQLHLYNLPAIGHT